MVEVRGEVTYKERERERERGIILEKGTKGQEGTEIKRGNG